MLKLIYIIGVVVAWFQVKAWNRDNEMDWFDKYVLLTAYSLLSWLIYPLHFIETLDNE